MRPWSDRAISDCGEPLQSLPRQLLRLTPHPYVIAGAPYPPGCDPFRLRSGVLTRLVAAQRLLQQQHPGLRLAIFDAWRPVAVQRYMVDHAIGQECHRRGVDRQDPGQASSLAAVIRDVGRFWAPPSDDPATPPPHSTGAAVDLTLAPIDDDHPVAMGGEIDAIGAVSEPEFYADLSDRDPSSVEAVWHGRRQLLQGVMLESGFQQHPNEWWHFSHGDQLWAWRSGARRAIYAGVPSSSATA